MSGDSHRTSCGGVWCVHGEPWRPDGLRYACCGRCGLIVVTMEAWAAVDVDAFESCVDPNGVQRAFLNEVS